MEIYNANEILQRLTFFSNLSTKKELSKVLNVSYNTLQTWIKRNSIDFDYIYSHVKKNNISLDKLFKIDEDSLDLKLYFLQLKLNKFKLNSLITLSILLKQDANFHNSISIINFNNLLLSKLKPVLISIKEDKLSFIFDQKHLIKEITQELTNEDIQFLTAQTNLTSIHKILDELIIKKKGPILNLFDFTKIARSIFN